MAEVKGDCEGVPSYFHLLRCIYNFVETTIHEAVVEKVEHASIAEQNWRYVNFCLLDVLLVILLAGLWTVIRYFTTEWLFKPLGHYFALTPTNQKKMPESAWKLLYYLCAWSYSLYVVILSGRYEFFQKPSTVWEGWTLDEPPPFDIYSMYLIQCGFYVHSLYATAFLDTWRKDSVVMMIHHVLTLALISISYSLRYHNIGALVLFLHDMCDIQLEFTKLNVYFKFQGGKHVNAHEILANATFFCFAVTWFVSRLYWYPLKVLYTATCDVERMQLILPCATLMNSLLWFLQALNIYWYMFVIGFLFRVATGQVKEVDDTREYDVEEMLSKKVMDSKNHKIKNGDILHNGDTKSNGVFQDGAVLNGDKEAVSLKHRGKVQLHR